MQCEKCKIKRATVFYTELDRTRHALCAICAENEKNGSISEKEKSFIPRSYLYEVVHNIDPIYIDKEIDALSLSCTYCKTKLSDIVSFGRMGCQYCYEEYSSFIKLSDLTGNNAENNRMPRRYMKKKELECKITALKENLKIAVKEENYDYAAKLKHEIDGLTLNEKRA